MQINNRVVHHPAPSPLPSSTGRALVPFTRGTDLVRTGQMSEGRIEPPNTTLSLTGNSSGSLDVRHISPSEMTEISLDLYAMGLVSFDDYSALAYHPELHPQFDKTIGALTGDMAAPRRKRNFISEWEEKGRFLKLHSPDNKQLVDQSERITGLLRSLAQQIRLYV